MNPKIKRILVAIAFVFFSFAHAEDTVTPENLTGKADVNLVASYPHLKQYLFEEKDTKIRFGFGLSPLQLMKQKAAVGLSIFQVHLMTPNLDWEMFNASFAMTISGEAISKMYSFNFRSFPKWRISDGFSLGLIVGYEFVSFPEVKAQLRNPTTGHATFVEPMSARGLIYGVGASQIMHAGKDDQMIRINEIVYRQNYSVLSSLYGWEYVYSENSLNTDTTPIESGYVFMLELSFLY